MKTVVRTALAALFALLIFGCSSGGSNDVRSKPATNATTTTEAEVEAAEPAVARASQFVGGNIDPAFGPGEPGELSVIAIGTPDGESDSIPFVVRNNTSGDVYDVSATGRVTQEGQLVGSGEDQGVQPMVVAPGEIAFGYVYFSATPPAGSTVEVSVTADSEVGDYFVPMIIGQANLVPGEYGDQIIVGEVTAPGSVEVQGPVSVLILCVDEAGTLAGNQDAFTDGDASILPGSTATYSAHIYGDAGCPTFLIGSSGYTY